MNRCGYCRGALQSFNAQGGCPPWDVSFQSHVYLLRCLWILEAIVTGLRELKGMACGSNGTRDLPATGSSKRGLLASQK